MYNLRRLQATQARGRKEVNYTAWSTHERRMGRERPDVASYVHHRLENLTTVQKQYPQLPHIFYEGIEHTLARNAGQGKRFIEETQVGQ
jgi:hypothetical protein